MHSTRSEPTRLEESFSTMITVPLLLTWDPLVSIRNSPLSTRFNSSLLFLGAFLHLVLRMVLNNTQFLTLPPNNTDSKQDASCTETT